MTHREKAKDLLYWIDGLEKDEKPTDEVLVVAVLAVAHALLARDEPIERRLDPDRPYFEQ